MAAEHDSGKIVIADRVRTLDAIQTAHARVEYLKTKPQPAPIPNDHKHIVDVVMQDLAERKAHGVREYGTALQPFNGRDMLLDAYQEALDLAIYLRGELEERSITRDRRIAALEELGIKYSDYIDIDEIVNTIEAADRNEPS